MKTLSELSERIGDHVMGTPISDMGEVQHYVELEFAKFREEWPGDYQLYWSLEGESKLVIGVKFKSIKDKDWAEIRWS